MTAHVEEGIGHMEITDHEGLVVLDLGDGPNAVDTAFLDGLNAGMDRVEADEAATGFVTKGSGKHYCNGFDLEYMGSLEGDDLVTFLDYTATTLGRLLVLPVPTVAVLNGHAFGAGAMAVLAHDLRVQNSDRGWFCLPEVDLGMQFLPFQLELITSRLTVATANEAILTGRRYDGDASVAAGIAHASASPDELLAAAAELAAPWSGKVRENVGRLKRQLNAGALALLPDAPAPS